MAQGMEKGMQVKLREQVRKKMQKGLSIPEIADMLEENEQIINEIVESLK